MNEKYSFRVEKLAFRPSSSKTVETEHALRSKVIVFMGPNNPGKSRALKEIRSEILGLIGRENNPNADKHPSACPTETSSPNLHAFFQGLHQFVLDKSVSHNGSSISP